MRVVWCLLVLCATATLAQPLVESREKRDAGVVNFPDTPVAPRADNKDDGPILSEASAATDLARDARSPDGAGEDYEEVEEDGPEGRHLHKIKRKLKRKFKPHKYQSILGGFGGYGGHGHGGHHHGGHHHGGYGGFGGWQGPSYGGGPIATAIAGPSYGGGGGGWNPGFGGGGFGHRPNAQASAWNFGPFSIGFANAGK